MLKINMNLSSFETFCGSSLWDVNLTWYTPNNSLPDITPCMQHVALVWLPCSLLWLTLIPYLIYLKRTKKDFVQKLNKFSAFKSCLPLLIACLRIYELAASELQAVDWLSSFLIIITMVLAAALVQIYRKKGYFSSGPLWMFWMLWMLCNLLQLYSTYKRYYVDGDVDYSHERYISAAMTFFSLLCLIMASISDAGEAARSYYKTCSPEVLASFPSIFTYHWAVPILKKGYAKRKEGIGREDLYNLVSSDRMFTFHPRFEKDWLKRSETAPTINGGMTADELTPLIIRAEQKSNKTDENSSHPSLVGVLLKHWLPMMALSWVVRVIAITFGFTNPLCLSWLIEFMTSQTTDSPQPLWKGFILCFIIFTSLLIRPSLWSIQRLLEMKISLRMSSSLLAAVYRKSLTMSCQARREASTGKIVNLMAIDVQRTVALVKEIYVYIFVTVQTTIAMFLLHQLVGNAVFAGVAIIILGMPFTLAFTKVQSRFRRTALEIKDERIRMINEVLNAIKVIKLYAWEPSFQSKIGVAREKEIRLKRKIGCLRAVLRLIFELIPILTTIVIFAIYTANQPDHILSPQVAFVSLSLLEYLRNGLNLVPQSISFAVECYVSLKRLRDYFKKEDLDESNVKVDRTAKYAICISSASFSHQKDQPASLHCIDLQVKEASLAAITGSVGCGKSSLLGTLIGDLHKHQGSVTLKGSIALVAQQAFILNASVRDNILFGSEYCEQRYTETIEACALMDDLNVLPNGDRTMIGEKGINLSGGQKQRVSLARAVYSNADIYLLDDPLSSVDAHVGRHIFDKVIGPDGLLAAKTRLMVTHGIHWLSSVDEVYVMKDGRIEEKGSYEQLMSHNGEFSKLVQTYFSNEDNVEPPTSEDVVKEEGDNVEKNTPQPFSSVRNNSTEQKPKRKTKSNVFEDEEQVETGKVSWTVYLTYLKAVGRARIFLPFLLIIVAQSLGTAYSIWLSEWTGDSTFSPSSNKTDVERQNTMEMYLGVLTAIGSGQVLATMGFMLGTAYCLYFAGNNLHSMLLAKILKAKMTFFDVKPIGMILNRFSKDIEVVDNSVGWSIQSATNITVIALASLFGIGYSTAYLIIPVVLMGVVFYFLQKYFISTARHLRRLRNKSSSPIFAHFSETLNGSQTIRAYGHQQRFIQDNIEKVENRNTYLYFADIANGWLEFRMQAVGAVLVLVCSVFCVISTRYDQLSKMMTPSIVGLLMSFVLKFLGILNRVIWWYSHLETNIVSVERIKEYTEVEQEAEWSCDHPPTRPWPTEGKVKFESYSTRYRPELDLVIKDLSVSINPGEKIGIVGRTGAGKSSLTLSMFRLLEGSEGSITIDGVNIANIGLHDLRNNITILPQDPTMFSGSIRENLDPLARFPDDRLWEVLDQCLLKDFVLEKEEKLSYHCGEGGQNLSMGQRQLICLARALLRKTKILVMDEATAAVDLRTDEFIQKTIRSEFTDCSVLTIAHRLNTIIDCDRIMVMDKGRVVEIGSPERLLADKDTIFSSMAREAGVTCNNIE